MSDQSNLTGKVGLDVTDFKSGIATLNREIRVIESGFRAAAAGLGDWAKSATGLEARIKALTGQIDIQKAKVMALEAEYKRVAAEKGKTSRAAQDLQIRLNKETETLNKMQLELGQTEKALSEMGEESQDAAKGADNLARAEGKAETATGRLRGALDRLKGSVKNVITDFKALGTRVLRSVAIGIAAIGAAAVGAAIGLGRFVTNTARAADEIFESAEKLGISTTKYQEFSFVADQIGTDVESIGRAFARTTKSLKEADKAGSPMAKTFEDLGISTRDTNGNLRDTEAVFSDIIGALGKVENETQREIIAQTIFGKSYQELIPLINLGADGLAAMTDEAHKMGAVMGEETVKGLADLNDRLGALKGGFKGLLGQMAGKLLPTANKVLDAFQAWLASPQVQAGIERISKRIGEFADTLGRVIDKMLKGDIKGALSELIPRETVDQITAFAKTVKNFVDNTLIPFVTEHAEEIKGAFIGIGAALAAAGIVAVIASIASGIGPLIAIVGLLGAAWAGNWGGIRTTLTEWWESTGRPIFEQLKTWLSENLPIAIQALKDVWENVLLPALQTVWAWMQGTLFPFLQELAEWWVSHFVANLQTFVGFWNGTLYPALQTVWNFLKNDLFPLFQAIGEFFGAVFGLAIRVLAGLWENVLAPALEKVWNWLSPKLMPIFEALVTFFNDKAKPAIETIATVFDNISKAIEGIIGWLGKLTEKIDKIDLPDWLKPGSPTPFELGLRGIADAIAELNRTSLPKLRAGLGGLDLQAGLGAGSSPAFAARPTPNRVVAIGGDTISVTINDRLAAKMYLEQQRRKKEKYAEGLM